MYMYRCAAVFTLTLMVIGSLAAPAAAQEATTASLTPLADGIARVAADAPVGPNLWTLSQKPKRPTTLAVLYGSYGLLQAMDIVTTRQAIAAGAHEANPVIKKGNMGAMLAVKAAGGAATMFVAEKMWKKNRVGAVVLMAVANGVSAAVVAHNHRNAQR